MYLGFGVSSVVFQVDVLLGPFGVCANFPDRLSDTPLRALQDRPLSEADAVLLRSWDFNGQYVDGPRYVKQ